MIVLHNMNPCLTLGSEEEWAVSGCSL